jgi:hypothetical protein
LRSARGDFAQPAARAASIPAATGTRDWPKKTEDWQVETAAAARSLLFGDNTFIEPAMRLLPRGSGGRVMIGQTFTLVGSPKLVFRLVWRGSIAGIDCVRGVALNGKFQTLRRATDVVFVEAA